ncbi:MAG: hypothetical protein LBS41_05320 [Streptococcaceae bacterium]|jgi:hypothetical protein|nr:hypothetical protein [Streptococcaceae bacterium]
MQTKHQTQIPDYVLEEVQDMINKANALLAPYQVVMTPKERLRLPRMGNKTLSFVAKALDYAQQYPQYCPTYLNLSDFVIDMADATKLRRVLIISQQLSATLDNTVVVSGSEAFQAALIFYQAIKAAANQGVPGAKEVYLELKERFPQASKKRADLND